MGNDDPEIIPPEVLLEGAEAKEQEQLEEFFERVGEAGCKIRIYRYNEDKEDYEYITRVPAEDVASDPLDYIKRHHGGGKYKLHLLSSKGKFVPGGHRILLIADKKEDVVTAAPVSPLADPTVQLLLTQQQNSQAQMLEIVKSFAGAPKAEGLSPIAMLDLAAKFQAMMPKGSKEMGFKEMLESFQVIQGLISKKSDGEEGKGILGDLTEAMEVAKKVGFFDRRPGLQPAPPAAALPDPRAAAQRPRPVAPTDPISKAVYPYLPLFVAWARDDKPVEDAAKFLLDRLDDDIVPTIMNVLDFTEGETWEKLTESAGTPELIAKVFVLYPALAPHREWVEAVIARAVELDVYDVAPVPTEKKEVKKNEQKKKAPPEKGEGSRGQKGGNKKVVKEKKDVKEKKEEKKVVQV